MTIKVEQETLLRVLESQKSYSSLSSSSSDDYIMVDYRNGLPTDDYHVEKIRQATSDDEDSVLTYSTASLSDSDSDSDSECERRVSFAPEVVTEVWTRPYTLKEEIADLFYSNEETQR
jgi:hypothetical protein